MQLVSASTKLRQIFYTQLERRTFHTAWTHTGSHPLSDDRGAAMDLAEAREHAEGLVRRPVMTPSVEDWRSWILHVTDELGDELFYVPFASVLGKLH
jgi:hypothetical protein